MPHNAVLEDEQTGETLMLWAITSEKLQFKNKLTGKPIEVKGESPAKKMQEADNLHHEPMTLKVIADLVGDPAESGPGGPGYEIEQYNKLVSFSNRDTTFKWTSYMFVQQAEYTQIIQPGLVIAGLGMANFSALKSNRKSINIIGANIDFQSIVFTSGGDAVDSETAWDRGNQDLDTSAGPGNLFAAAGGVAAGILAGAAAVAAGWALAPVIAVAAAVTLVVTGVIAFIGWLASAIGSVPYQRFTTRIDGKDIDFWLRSNEEYDIVTMSVAYDGEFLVRERRVVYAEDLLQGITAPALRGLYILPLDPSDTEVAVTPENLGRTVHLCVFKDNS